MAKEQHRIYDEVNGNKEFTAKDDEQHSFNGVVNGNKQFTAKNTT